MNLARWLEARRAVSDLPPAGLGGSGPRPPLPGSRGGLRARRRRRRKIVAELARVGEALHNLEQIHSPRLRAHAQRRELYEREAMLLGELTALRYLDGDL